MTRAGLFTLDGRAVLDVYVCAGAGPRGGSAKRLQDWIERWRTEPVDLLVAHDHSHVLAVARR